MHILYLKWLEKIPVLLIFVSVTLYALEYPDSKGKNFWLAFTYNGGAQFGGSPAPLENSYIGFMISSERVAKGNVSIPGIGFNQLFTTTPGVVTYVKLAREHVVSNDDGVEKLGINITSDEEITVYALNQEYASTDAYLGLPVDVLGEEYYTMCYPSSAGSYVTIAATDNSTLVTITPSRRTVRRQSGVSYTVTLQRGEVYNLKAYGSGSDSLASDLTGTRIQSNKPVAVFSGNQLAQVPNGYVASDFLAEQIPPVSSWGKNFVTVQLVRKIKGDIFRFLASENSAVVKVNGMTIATLNRGEFYEKLLSGNNNVTSDKPILLAQFATSTMYDNEHGEMMTDPFMSLIPPSEQFLSSYTLSTPDKNFTINHLNIIASKESVGELKINNKVIGGDRFKQIGTTDFYALQDSIVKGSHTIVSAYPVGVTIYGWGSYIAMDIWAGSFLPRLLFFGVSYYHLLMIQLKRGSQERF
jgi:hypothetical protein